MDQSAQRHREAPTPDRASDAVRHPEAAVPRPARAMPATLPSDAATLLALQQGAGNAAVLRLMKNETGSSELPGSEPTLMRQTPAAAPPAAAPSKGAQVGTGYTFELPEGQLLEFGQTSYITGGLASKGEVMFQPVAAGSESPPVTVGGANQGVKLDVDLAKQEGVEFGKSIKFDEVTETLSWELSKKKLDLSLAVTGKVKTKFPFVSGLAEGKFVLVGVEWEKIKDYTAGGIEISGGVSGEGPIKLGGIDVLVKAKVTLTGTAKLNWPRILAKAGEEGGKHAVKAVATEGGATVVSVDLAAVAGSAAAVAVPAAAAVAIGYGMHIGIRNARAAQEAAGAGVQARAKARAYAKGYAKTLTGSKGDGEGAAEAERQIKEIVDKTNASREIVTEEIKAKQGGYGAIYKQSLDKIRNKLYEDGVRTFDDSHRQDFSWVDELGETWGQRGVFRKTFRMVLFADEE